MKIEYKHSVVLKRLIIQISNEYNFVKTRYQTNGITKVWFMVRIF